MPRVIRAATRAAVSENGLLVSYAPTPSGNQGGAVADIDPFARIERGVLLGLPIALKESFNVAGLETTCGVPESKGYDR